jgi:alanine dehydrogenase
VLGAGTQARTQIQSLAAVLPLQQVRVVGRNPSRAAECAQAIRETCGLSVEVVSDAAAAISSSDVVVTCTSATQALFSAAAVRPGTFIAAVGADSPGKQELDPALVAASTVVADVHSQSIRVGELQHAIGAGLMTADQVHAEIGQVLCGDRPGRSHDAEVTIYDSTGTALQDVAVGLVVYEQALKSGLGISIQLGE